MWMCGSHNKLLTLTLAAFLCKCALLLALLKNCDITSRTRWPWICVPSALMFAVLACGDTSYNNRYVLYLVECQHL